MKTICKRLMFCSVLLLAMMDLPAAAQEEIGILGGTPITVADDSTLSVTINGSSIHLGVGKMVAAKELSACLTKMRAGNNGDMVDFDGRQWMLIKNSDLLMLTACCGVEGENRLINVQYREMCDWVILLMGKPAEIEEEEEIFIFPEEEPMFGSSTVEAVNNYVKNNIRLPNNQTHVSGTVYVLFIVEKDGTVSNIKVLRGLGCEFDQEVERVAASMLNWKPGRTRGMAVRSQCVVPIRFGMQ